MAVTIKSIFEQSAAKYPHKEALVDERIGIRWTYAEWNKEANRLAHALSAAGVSKGDRVSTILYNTAELATALFACSKIGAVFNPVNYRLASGEVEFILKDAAPKVVIVEEATVGLAAPSARLLPAMKFWCIDGSSGGFAKSYKEELSGFPADDPDCELEENDICSMMYTSGTTGLPKGVLHSHRDLADQSLCMAAVQRLSPHERGLSAAPMFHCAELHCAFLPRLHLGGTNVILHHFEAKEVIRTVKKEKITSMFAAPTMWSMLLQENVSASELATLRHGLYGGAPMAPALVKQLAGVLDIRLYQAYGMTEMGPAITVLLDDEQLAKAGSAGRPLINHEVRVVRTREAAPSDPEDMCGPGERGEIIVRGPSMMSGYFNRPKDTEAALFKGWYHSGDIGSLDEDGFLWVSDRVKDMIVSGGENIYSREVEDILFDHPDVLDVAVIGEPDEVWGEKVVAVIVKKHSGLTAEDLDAFCLSGSRLARYKRPRKYIFVSELPRNASGKLQKYKLRESIRV